MNTLLRNLTIFFVLILNQIHAQDFELIEKFDYYLNKQVSYDSSSMGFKSFSLIEGDFIVFAFTSNNAGDEGNYSQAESQIIFQIDESLDAFELLDSDILANQGLYMQKCRCQDKGIQMIEDGRISGQLLENGAWFVEIDVHFIGARTGKEYHIQKSGKYYLNN